MANTRAKEVSESYKGTEITFDKTTPAAIIKGFTADDLQSAVVEAKPLNASKTVVGIVRGATDPEVAAQTDVNAYVTPPQLYTRLNSFWLSVIKPAIPPAVVLPPVVYGGATSLSYILSVFGAYPVGTIVVFDEYYTYEVGWGNGSSTVGAYRRRTVTRTSNSGWLFVG